jgi:hypothetical protein
LLSTTNRSRCDPAVSGIPAWTIDCQVCHPPVSGTTIGPVASTPSTSTWNVPPGPAEATRASSV